MYVAYDFWLQHTSFDFESSCFSPIDISKFLHTSLCFEDDSFSLTDSSTKNLLLCSLFTLRLGHLVSSVQLNCYEEVHEVRAAISSFITKWSSQMTQAQDKSKLWWDEILIIKAPAIRWLSTKLREDKGFLPILDSWLHAGQHLQAWLEDFEAKMEIVDNPQNKA